MRLHRSLSIVLLCCLSATVLAGGQHLNVYTYPSFTDAGEQIATIYQQRYGLKIKFYTDSELMLTNIKQGRYHDGVVIGFSNIDSLRWSDEEIRTLFRPLPEATISPKPAQQWHPYLLPYDYSQTVLIYNHDLLPSPPQTVAQLAAAEYRQQIIYIDPYSSSLGLSFLLGLEKVSGQEFGSYLRRLRPNILTVAPNWNTAYTLFLQGEAPMVLSMTTSEAYHLLEEGPATPYRTVALDEGAVNYIEGAGILSRTQNVVAAERLITLLLDQQVQTILNRSNVMLPVTQIDLPEAYRQLPELNAIPLPDYGERARAKIRQVEELWSTTFSSQD